MSVGRAIFLTARREVLERVRSRAYLASTGLILALVAGVFAIAAFTGGGPESVRLAVAGERGEQIAMAAAERAPRYEAEIEMVPVSDAAAAGEAVRAGDVDLALIGERLTTGPGEPERAVAAIEDAARELQVRERVDQAGLTPSQAEDILAVPGVEVVTIADSSEDGTGLALFAAIVLYLAIFTAGLQVATGVVEEKGSRVIELVLSAIRPAQLLVGKVLGIGITAFAQLLAVFALWLGLALATGEIDLPASAATTTVLVVVYFLLGYAFYACGFAAAAALVSRQEDVQNTTAPMMIALVGGYLLSLGAVEDPGSSLATVCSLLPPVAPMVIPVRAAQDALPLSELLLSLGAMVAGTLALIWLGARIYERSVLRIGAPVKLAAALRRAR